MTSGTASPLWALRTVVTGGTGFVGARVCERLLGLGAHVQCVDEPSAGGWRDVEHLRGNPRFTAVPADPCEGLPVSGAVDWVLHLAWPGSPADPRRMSLGSMQLGCVGTQRALDLATEQDARFLLVSSAGSHGEAVSFVQALSAAYRSALAVDTGIVCVVDAFGPRMPLDDSQPVARFVRQALRGEPLTVTGDGSRILRPCFVDDTVGGILTMAGSAASGPVDLAGRAVTELALATEVIRVSGTSATPRFTGLAELGSAARPPDVTPAERVLGWAPSVSLAEGLARTLDWAAARVVTGA